MEKEHLKQLSVLLSEFYDNVKVVSISDRSYYGCVKLVLDGTDIRVPLQSFLNVGGLCILIDKIFNQIEESNK